MSQASRTQEKTLILVNFGGPRNLNEVRPFLTELLTDQEVVRTSFPKLIHRLFFSYVARKRARFVALDYAKIGGKSPIFEDTEAIASSLKKQLGMHVIPFHRYLPSTHAAFIRQIEETDDEPVVFPLFPQYSYATTGSIALWFAQHLESTLVNRLRWIPSYADESSYTASCIRLLKSFLKENGLKEEESLLFFSPHGLPQTFISTGDVYETQCKASYKMISEAFPSAKSLLAYQSKFGKGEWLRPYTIDVCEKIEEYAKDKKHVVFFPLSFTSDHIETLFEVEEQYLPVVRKKGYQAWRCPALNLREDWISTIAELIQNPKVLLPTEKLLRDC